ncbi:MAG TPA: serpin family protein [Gemmataceae bacterium]
MRTPTVIALGVALGAALTCAGGEEPRTGPAAEEVVKGNNQFALDLYARLRERDGNLFLSPFSISTALAMTATGAEGRTLEQMQRVLHLPKDREATNAGFAALLKRLNAAGGDAAKRPYELAIANALWGAAGKKWRPEFLAATREHYGAGLREVDFTATEQARRTINAWVEEQTRDRIRDLIPKGVLNSDTKLVLTNAIYFKGQWEREFSRKATRPEKFYVSAGKTVEAPLMHRSGRYRYGEAENLQFLELPYRGNALSMVVLLPREKTGLAAMEKELTDVNLTAWLGKLRPEPTVRVWLPRFKVTTAFRLADELKAMGMTDAFSRAAADLSGMTGERDLFVSEVVHKAFVEVNEEGTEAAAATGVIVAPTSAPIEPKVIPTFRADHPFVFLIRDNRSGSVLFLGRVTNPAE